jgi:RNA polymerase sigma factor (sigma-70 family)
MPYTPSRTHDQSNDDKLNHFATTHWNTVRTASDMSGPGSGAALEELCRRYWYPLYAHARREGYDRHDAEDITQEFLARIMEGRALQQADPQRGRFRSFLLGSLKNHLLDQNKKACAQKRGGGQSLISLDAESAENSCELASDSNLSSERVFDRQWALAIMGQTVSRLREEYAMAERLELFEEVKQFRDDEEPTDTYATAAARLGLSVSAFKSAIYRMRQRHRDLLREEVARTVETAADVDEEIRYLISVLAG